MSDQKIKVTLELEPKMYQKLVKDSKQNMTVEEWIIKLLQKEKPKVKVDISIGKVKIPVFPPVPVEDFIQLPEFDMDIPQ